MGVVERAARWWVGAEGQPRLSLPPLAVQQTQKTTTWGTGSLLLLLCCSCAAAAASAAAFVAAAELCGRYAK